MTYAAIWMGKPERNDAKRSEINVTVYLQDKSRL